MTVAISQDNIGNFETIVMENSKLRAVIIPELGGRVWELTDIERSRQWIWHREDTPLKISHIGDSYDDVWAGGWEELFPNDAACMFEGRNLPDHGEWWTMRWTKDESSNGSTGNVRLISNSSVIQAKCSKEFHLDTNEASLTVHYRIKSKEPKPFHFLFKQHLAIALTQDCRLWLPGGRVQAVDASFGNILPEGGPFDWPIAKGCKHVVDLQDIPSRSSQSREFIYISDLPKPLCGVIDKRRSALIHMNFDPRQLPFVWLFLSYGGWQNIYAAVLEPCTNLPKDLLEAVRFGQSAQLEPDQEFNTTVSVTLGGTEEIDS